jgi:hypothetical protein
MPWSVRAVPLPDGDRPADLWIDTTGCLAAGPVPGAEPLPGRYVAPGLVDAHAHPALGPGLVPRDDDETMTELAAWAAAGVALVRDTGSPGGSVLGLGLGPGLPRLQAAGRFLAPAGRYFPALLPEEVPEQRLTELALAELARGGRWVKVIADFPPVVDGKPSGPAALTYSVEAVEAMIAAVHAAGGRVAAHVTTDVVAQLVRARGGLRRARHRARRGCAAADGRGRYRLDADAVRGARGARHRSREDPAAGRRVPGAAR